ncbi:uncharacterized protein EAF01_005172 [Botrytis porri]|uniref:Uncharacterized protein n=1 Tax=Botrytis porri TaxID=87229 RepID=A0A4Z1KTD2_9HELO|nr:uncharacterized protein EAF01_005172 [Botrytis porri]KAF7907586.1 hypothetical protein EAF01_005172 [Botrytis porri]TGO87315.1 hypothetical protein BPOR_0234g00010 [Botrytis porri]
MSNTSRSPLSSQTPQSPSQSPLSPLKRKKMSITQTYYLAHTARGKLSFEASRADHDLRLLVGHANLLDSLMLELAEAEQEQESWFNQSVRKATKQEEPKHIQWADNVVEEVVEEEEEEDWETSDLDNDDSSDSDSEFDSDEELEEPIMTSLTRVYSNNIHTPITVSSREIEEDEESFEDDGEEDYSSLQLHLTKSHYAASSPPELDHDSDSSEDESMPPSPPSDTIPTFSEKQQIATTSYYSKSTPSSSIPQSEQQTFFDEGFYLPPRQSPGLISAISVY